MKNEFVNISGEFLNLGHTIILISSKLYKYPEYRFIANQLSRSGTSSGANYEEACAAQSRADFIHKMHISYKELKETYYWLKLIEKTGIINGEELENSLLNTEKLIKIIAASIKTSKNNHKD